MKQQLRYEEFIEVIKEEVQSRLGQDYKVETKKIVKNNNTILQALLVGRNDSNLQPAFYLEGYYQEYSNHLSMEAVVEDLVNAILKEGNQDKLSNIKFSFENMVNKIVYRVVNYERNGAYVKDSPHIRCMDDLVMLFYCVVEMNDSGVGSIRITNQHLAQFGITLEELQKIAVANTVRLFPKKIGTMEDIIFGLMGEQEDGADGRDDYETNMAKGSGMYVITKQSKMFGAGAILYPNVISKFAETMECDVIILPSSLHELIVLPYKDEVDIDQMRAMVREINSTQVAAEEVLSDNVYVYERKVGKIRVA
jgi:hypothetical protein